jgi:hypothetical protein
LGSSWIPVLGLPVSAVSITRGIIAKRHIRALSQQGGRLAVEYAINAGYDGREVSTALKALSTNAKSAPKHTAFERNWFRVAADTAATQVGESYRDTDFTKLKIGTDTFMQLATQVQAASSSK